MKKMRDVLIWAALLVGAVGLLYGGLATYLAVAGGTP